MRVGGGVWLLGPAREEIVSFAIYSKNSNEFELIQSKDGLPMIKQFEIKYGFL
jgi:hypothetical protein